MNHAREEKQVMAGGWQNVRLFCVEVLSVQSMLLADSHAP